MGKVKWLSLWGVRHSCVVSIPYGKGKGKAKASFAMAAAAYQFPMGKVKLLEATLLSYFTKYQFPMGKVKTK